MKTPPPFGTIRCGGLTEDFFSLLGNLTFISNIPAKSRVVQKKNSRPSSVPSSRSSSSSFSHARAVRLRGGRCRPPRQPQQQSARQTVVVLTADSRQQQQDERAEGEEER